MIKEIDKVFNPIGQYEYEVNDRRYYNSFWHDHINCYRYDKTKLLTLIGIWKVKKWNNENRN